MYLHFLSFLDTDMAQRIQVLPPVPPSLYYIVNTLAAAALNIQEARASAVMVLT